MQDFVATCDNCHNKILFDDSDTQVGPVAFQGGISVYVVCPVCGDIIVVGGFHDKTFDRR